MSLIPDVDLYVTIEEGKPVWKFYNRQTSQQAFELDHAGMVALLREVTNQLNADPPPRERLEILLEQMGSRGRTMLGDVEKALECVRKERTK